jgi:hypothetical protein
MWTSVHSSTWRSRMTYLLIVWLYTQNRVIEIGFVDLATCEAYQKQAKLWPDKPITECQERQGDK